VRLCPVFHWGGQGRGARTGSKSRKRKTVCPNQRLTEMGGIKRGATFAQKARATSSLFLAGNEGTQHNLLIGGLDQDGERKAGYP